MITSLKPRGSFKPQLFLCQGWEVKGFTFFQENFKKSMAFNFACTCLLINRIRVRRLKGKQDIVCVCVKQYD